MVLDTLRQLRAELALTPAARAERRRDARGLPVADPGIAAAVAAAAEWLGRAQDRSASGDGGVARHYSLRSGWATSYPETTGYIVPTMLALAEELGDAGYRERARRMLDWLVSIQLPGGGFQGGRIDARPVVPVTFNTGQILMGLAAGHAVFGGYAAPLRNAADWLVATQDEDGCWRRYPTPFAKRGEKVYETHVAWGLFEAERVMPGLGYGEAGLRQVRWALEWQRDNGWFDRCCLTDPGRPLTHTLGYALRGIVEAWRLTRREDLLRAARRTADGLLEALDDDGRLPGRLRPDWSGGVASVCLTGSAQIAHSWLLLYQATGDERYLVAGRAANRYVRRSVRLDGGPGVRGGVKGSFPIDGDYGPYEYLNWAVKFAIDAFLLEKRLIGGKDEGA